MILLLRATKKGGNSIAQESRADYFKKRREEYKAFHVEVVRDKMEIFEKKLAEKKTTKKQWLDEKIDEEIGK